MMGGFFQLFLIKKKVLFIGFHINTVSEAFYNF